MSSKRFVKKTSKYKDSPLESFVPSIIFSVIITLVLFFEVYTPAPLDPWGQVGVFVVGLSHVVVLIALSEYLFYLVLRDVWYEEDKK